MNFPIKMVMLLVYIAVGLIGCDNKISDPLILEGATDIKRINSESRYGFEFKYDFKRSSVEVIKYYDSLYLASNYSVLKRFYSDDEFDSRNDNGNDILWFAREWLSNDKKTVKFLEIKEYSNSSVLTVVSQSYKYVDFDSLIELNGKKNIESK